MAENESRSEISNRTKEPTQAGRKQGFQSFYIPSVAGVLVLTALAKFVSSAGSARVLLLTDPLLGIQTRYLLALVGVLEAALALYLFFGRDNWTKLALTAWLAGVFLVYRVGLWAMDSPKPCSCLGTLTDALPISPRAVDYGMKGILAYMLIGAIALLFRMRSAPDGDVGSDLVKESGAGV